MLEKRENEGGEKPGSSHSPDLSSPALYEVIPLPCLDRGNNQKIAARRLPGFSFSNTFGGLGPFPPSFRDLFLGAPVKLQTRSA